MQPKPTSTPAQQPKARIVLNGDLSHWEEVPIFITRETCGVLSGLKQQEQTAAAPAQNNKKNP
jgi:hypothetical protein